MLRVAWLRKLQILKGVVCQHLNRSSPVLAMMAAVVGAQLIPLNETEIETVQHCHVQQSVILQQGATVTPIGVFVSGHLTNEFFLSYVEDQNQTIQLQSQARQRWKRWIVGWTCYLLAIAQYLIIGLVTSRDRAMDVLSEFDRAVAQRRRELIEEFDLEEVAASQAEAAARSNMPPDDPPADSSKAIPPAIEPDQPAKAD